MLSEFLQNIDNIINEKRRLVKENKNVKKDEEKDLLTLMIESEINGEGGEGGLSNEELQVRVFYFIHIYHLLNTHNRVIYVFSSLLDMIQLPTPFPLHFTN